MVRILRLHTDVEPEPRDGRIVIQGEHRWRLLGAPDELKLATSALGGVCTRLSDEVALLDFGNAVGFFEIPGIGQIEVVSGKWDRSHFDQMLAELSNIASEMPFSAGTSASLPFERTVIARRNILYHVFVYVRHILSDSPANKTPLMPALHAIINDPHRKFEDLERIVSIDQVRKLKPSELSRVASGKGKFVRVGPSGTAKYPLARALQGYLPERVCEYHAASTFDTPENRFVKSFLDSVWFVLHRIRREVLNLQAESAFSTRVLRECYELEELLRPVLRHRVWNDVGRMTLVPGSSPVLQRRRGYREVYRHFVKMRLAARVPLDEKFAFELIEAKDIASLYEIWCYFIAVREITRLLGPPARAFPLGTDTFQVGLRRAIETVWANDVRLLYNAQFSRSSSPIRSYSISLRPDISLIVGNGNAKALHLFDAKFRVDRFNDPATAEDEDGIAEVGGSSKRDDLTKMHAYKDAITGVRTAWTLYPGTEFRYYGMSNGVCGFATLLPSELEGIGAIPSLPTSVEQSSLRQVLSHILQAS